MNHDKIRRASYDSFNGSKSNNQMKSFNPNYTMSTNSYDPDGLDGENGGGTTQIRTAAPGQKMQINLTLNNPTASKLHFELFNAYNSFTDILKPELVVATYSQIPMLSFEGLAARPNNINGFDQAGNVMIRGAVGLPVGTIGCAEYPYKSLLDTTKVLGFLIVVIRVSVATQAQFANNLRYIKKTYAGLDINNQINVRSYKRLINPAQLDIDVKAGVTVDGESGLQYDLEAGELVQMGLYINKWAKPSL